VTDLSKLKAQAAAALVLNPLATYCPISPHPKQREFLSLSCKEALFGGAARGGKTACLIMGALQYVHRAGYNALLLGRTYPDISQPGGMMDLAHQWLRETDAAWHSDTKTWTFPSGARISFGYLENKQDELRYRGGSYSYIGWDELTRFPDENQYLYLFSRLIPDPQLTDVPLRVRAATNPGGPGTSWVKSRFISDPQPGTNFLPSLVEDNPGVPAAEYRQSIAYLPEIERRQLGDGEWIEASADRVFSFEASRNVIDQLPTAEKWEHVLGIDLGWHDETAFIVIAFSKHENAAYVVHAEKHAHWTTSKVAERILQLDQEYRPTAMVCDTAGGSKQTVEDMRARYSLPLMPAEKRDKRGTTSLINADLEDGRLMLIRAATRELAKEMTELPWRDQLRREWSQHAADHLCDAMLYAWRESRHYLSADRPRKPLPGTRAHDEYLDAKYREQTQARIRREQSREYWDIDTDAGNDWH
jgi:hypothetical protein